MKSLLISILFFISFVVDTKAQLSYKNGVTSSTFIDYQKTFQRPDESFKRKEDTLHKQFEAKDLQAVSVSTDAPQLAVPIADWEKVCADWERARAALDELNRAESPWNTKGT